MPKGKGYGNKARAKRTSVARPAPVSKMKRSSAKRSKMRY